MKKFILVASVLAPVLTSAQQLGNVNTFLTSIGNLVNTALPIVVGLALLAFFWGLVRFIFAAGDEEKRKESRSMMIYSIIALFVMVSVWGLVGFIGQALGVGQGSGNNPVTVPIPRAGF